jgi:hypothetical protein
MNGYAFVNGVWESIKSAYCFHEGIGFVKLYSIKAHDGNDWKVIELDNSRQLVGAEK